MGNAIWGKKKFVTSFASLYKLSLFAGGLTEENGNAQNLRFSLS